MALRGTVCEIVGNEAIVEVRNSKDCGGCTACKSLGGDPGAPRKVRALLNGHTVIPGELVILDTNPGEGSLAALVVFGLPLVGFFAGVFAGIPIAGWFGYPGAEWQSVVGGVCGGTAMMVGAKILYAAGFLHQLSLKIQEKPAPRGDSPCEDRCS
jgi:hypothetical protein